MCVHLNRIKLCKADQSHGRDCPVVADGVNISLNRPGKKIKKKGTGTLKICEFGDEVAEDAAC